MKNTSESGFTLIELLVVMGVLAILASIVLLALNPARYFAQARNTQRTANVATILDAISQNIAEHKGVFTCDSLDPAIPTNPTTIKTTGGYNIGNCLIPNDVPALPFDPSATNAHYTNAADYDTGYQVSRDPENGRITVSAQSAELGTIVSITR